MKRFCLILVVLCVAAQPAVLFAKAKETVWSKQEKPILDGIRRLRSLSDEDRAKSTRQLARDIRALPKAENKLTLANALASLSTEGDFGHDTLQEVANTLADALRGQPQPEEKGQPAYPYISLAQLQKYERVNVNLDDAQYKAAMNKLQQDDAHRADADFTLSDIGGKEWNLKSLKGKVVLLNFWATWCPPCNRELPYLQLLQEKYKDQGFVVLAISDEELDKVKPFLEQRKLTFPVLLDHDRKVTEEFGVEGIPKSFVYDRDGKLVAEAIDMRTRRQFEELLAQAGLR